MAEVNGETVTALTAATVAAAAWAPRVMRFINSRRFRDTLDALAGEDDDIKQGEHLAVIIEQQAAHIERQDQTITRLGSRLDQLEVEVTTLREDLSQRQKIVDSLMLSNRQLQESAGMPPFGGGA